MDDWRSERPLGGVVGRLDAVDGDERSECRPDLEQVVGEPAVPAVAAFLREASASSLRSSVWDWGDLGLEPIAVAMFVLVGAPRAEHSAGQLNATLAEGFLFAQPIGVTTKIALDVTLMLSSA